MKLFAFVLVLVGLIAVTQACCGSGSSDTGSGTGTGSNETGSGNAGCVDKKTPGQKQQVTPAAKGAAGTPNKPGARDNATDKSGKDADVKEKSNK